QGSYICSDYGQTEILCQKQHATLKNVPIREGQDVCGLEILLYILIRNVLDLLDYLRSNDAAVDLPLDSRKILFGALVRGSRDNQPIGSILDRKPQKCLH